MSKFKIGDKVLVVAGVTSRFTAVGSEEWAKEFLRETHQITGTDYFLPRSERREVIYYLEKGGNLGFFENELEIVCSRRFRSLDADWSS